jgi:hypothetical protein
MKSFIKFALIFGGVLFFESLIVHYFPSIKNTAFTVGAYPISYWLCLMMLLLALGWYSTASAKRGRRR